MSKALSISSWFGGAILISTLSVAFGASPAGIRSVFLNGIDISGAKNQEMKNVDIMINERGDVFIIAPHYQVSEEDTYVPLARYVQGLNVPAHKPPQAVSAAAMGDTAVGQKVEQPKATPVETGTADAPPPSEATPAPEGDGEPKDKAGTDSAQP